MAITAQSLEKIKSGSISKVIEALGSKLKRVGREYVTQCVWHEDTNPSLTINDDKGFCFCHVCREGGDVIAYTQKRRGLSFPDAANLSAEILGIQVEHDGISQEEQERRKKARLAALDKLQRDQDLYRANLRHERAGRIRDILKARGLTGETSKEFGLGFAATGFFGGRITVPIYNHLNELVGWTGGRGCDLVLEATNSPLGIEHAARSSRIGGRVVLVGIPDGNTHNAVAIGPEGSGKTALINTIAARLVATKGIKHPSVI